MIIIAKRDSIDFFLLRFGQNPFAIMVYFLFLKYFQTLSVAHMISLHNPTENNHFS